MKKLLTLFCSVTTAFCFGQWAVNATIPANIAQEGLVAHPNGNIYLFNGYTASFPLVNLNTLYIYNIASNSWTTGANSPFTERSVAYCLGTDNKIYAMGGSGGGVQGYNSFARYDVSTNTWSTLASPANGCWSGSAASFNNKVYYAGGETFENVMRIYDIPTGTWSSGANLPTGVKQHQMVSTNNGYLYVFGGRDASSNAVNAIQRYDIAADSWSILSVTIPVQKNSFGACLAPDGRVYLVCGKDAYGNNAGPFFSDVNIFNPCDSSWSSGPAHPVAHGELAVTSGTNGIFAMGGTNGSGLNINYFLPVTPGQLGVPNIMASPSQICANNSATISVSGVSTYTWSSGPVGTSLVITPAANTTYTVTGTNSLGCSNAGVIVISVTPSPTITVNNGTICAGDSFTIMPNGALSYTFSGGSAVVSPIVNTTYTVTGTNSQGCSNDAVSNITVNSPTVTVNSGAICFGDSFTITPSGASNYTYSGGSAVVSPTVNTSYSVTGSDANGCMNVGVGSVSVNSLPVLLTTTNYSFVCKGNSATLTASGAVTYTWSNSAGTSSIVVTPTASTGYTVSGTDANGCDGTSTITQSVSLCTGISAISGENFDVKIYPNPGAGILHLDFTSLSDNRSVELYDNTGRLILSEKLTSLSSDISFEQAANGIYMIRFIENGRNVFHSKVVKQ